MASARPTLILLVYKLRHSTGGAIDVASVGNSVLVFLLGRHNEGPRLNQARDISWAD